MREYEKTISDLRNFNANYEANELTNDAADAIDELLAVKNHLESCIDQALDALDRGADNDWAREALEKAVQFPEPPKED